MAKDYSFASLCDALHRSQVYIRNLMSGLDLPLHRHGERFGEPYRIFLQKVVALRTLGIPLDDIRDLFLREKKILEMLHVDTHSDSPTWYLDGCQLDGHSDSRLFLTSHDVGFSLHAGAFQPGLNFGPREKELFTRAEMGEDVIRYCEHYTRALQKLKVRIQAERIVVRNALLWADRVC